MNRNIINDLNKSIDMLKACNTGTHSEKWASCVRQVKEKGNVDSPEAVCTEALGEESFKSFAKSDTLTQQDMQKVNMVLLRKASEEVASLAKGFEGLPDMDSDVVESIEKSDANLLTETLDMLYGEPTLPRQFVAGDLPPFEKKQGAD